MEAIRIQLLNERRDRIVWFTVFLFLVEWLTMIMLSQYQSSGSIEFFGTISSILLNAGIMISYIINRKKAHALHYLMFGFVLFGLGWLMLGQPLIALMTFVFFVFGWKEQTPRIITLSQENIRINTFPQKKFAWNELDNFQCKEGLLTLDFKDNRLLQFSIHESLNPDLNEQHVMEFQKLILADSTNIQL